MAGLNLALLGRPNFGWKLERKLERGLDGRRRVFQLSLPAPAKVEEGTGTTAPLETGSLAEAGPKLLRGLLEVFILESLEQQPRHGYALLKEMGETFGQQPNRNRLYPLLAKLVADGYIREVSESGGNRTLYALTDQGREALHSYRRLPPQFRHALRRIWGHEGQDEPPPRAAAEGSATAREVRVRLVEDEEGGDAEGEEETPAPRAHAHEDDLPYPCPDARVDIRKDPRTGDLTLKLTGCPMGAYEYCPQCPVHKAVKGMRELVF